MRSAVSVRRVWRTAFLLSFASMVQAQGRPMTIDDMMELKNVGGVSISPNGKQVVYSMSGWEHPAARDTSRGDRHEMRSHVWLVATDGGEARQLTYGERGESNPQWSPDGRYISFVAARGAGTGDDAPRAQLWLMRIDGGEAWQITTVRDGVSGYAWSPDASKIAFISVDSLPRDVDAKIKRRNDPKVFEGDMRMTHAWVVDVASKQATKLTSGDFTVLGAPNWSPDGQSLTMLTRRTTLIRDERRDAVIVTIANKATQRIAPPAGMTIQANPVWSPDGRKLAFGAMTEEWKPNADSIFSRTLRNTQLVIYDIADKTSKNVGSAQFDYSVGGLRWVANGARIVFTAQDRVYPAAFSYDIASGKYTQLTKGMMLRAPSYSKDESVVAFAMDSPKSPVDVYVSDATFSNPRKLTSINPQVASFALGETEVVTWKSTDGWTVEGILLKPSGIKLVSAIH